MKLAEVATAQPYQVKIGSGAAHELAGLVAGRRAAVVCPHTLVRLVSRLGLDEPVVIEIPDAEAAKTPEVLVDSWRRLAEASMTRGDVIVGFGGGATTDVAGFLAATWMRGIDVIHVPTTVLAMADAAIGGKTGINIPAGKNLVGAFYEPIGVLCDTDLLTTLPAREVRSGLAEIVKCGFIDDPVILNLISNDAQAVLDGLAAYGGTRRRFETKGVARGVTVVDDYAHNPGKVEAVVRTAKEIAGEHRLWVIFQPHLYSRTRDFATGFAAGLVPADEVLLLDVYGAREDPVPGVGSHLISEPLVAQKRSARVVSLDEAIAASRLALILAGVIIASRQGSAKH